jgi:hypothetical protein
MTVSSDAQGRHLLEASFQTLISTGEMPVEQYFTPEYEQWTDGEKIGYSQFVQHMQALGELRKQGYGFDSFTIDEMVTEGNKIVLRHRLTGKTPAGQHVTRFVLALFEIHDGRGLRAVGNSLILKKVMKSINRLHRRTSNGPTS